MKEQERMQRELYAQQLYNQKIEEENRRKAEAEQMIQILERP
jgi:hypothetical protein